jgi:hypothetical protein
MSYCNYQMQYSIQSEDWAYSLGSIEEAMVPFSPSFFRIFNQVRGRPKLIANLPLIDRQDTRARSHHIHVVFLPNLLGLGTLSDPLHFNRQVA